MQTLLVYFSETNQTHTVALAVQKNLPLKLFRLETQKSLPKSNFFRMLFGVKQVLFKNKPPLKNPLPDLKKYKNIILGTPVWANHPAPALRTFLSQSNLSTKHKVFAFCTCSAKPGKTFPILTELLPPNSSLLSTHTFIKPSENPNLNQEILTWIQEIKPNLS